MSRSALLAGIFSLVLALVITSAPGQEPWPEKYYNPHPVEGDLLLPMPCGGSMAFRPVEVPSAGWLSDREVVLGGTDERFSHAENSRYAYLSGSFTDENDPARRRYYMAKFELTGLQRQALSGECPKASQKGRLPATGLAWFDAVELAENYNRWLLENAPDALPREDGARGYVRLPTEAEWEFAARGGISVTESVLVESVFPMPEGMPRYVWFGGPGSANGRLQLSGLLRPNPLGLHDMLGNADEIVLDPFRLNRLSRLHGQVGGFVIKGGNYLTSKGDIRSAYRQEITYYDDAGPNRVKTIGTRFMLSAPVLTSLERLEGVRQAWAALPSGLGVTAGTRVTDNPAEALEAILASDLPPSLRYRLEALNLTLTAALTEQNEQRNRAARGLVRLGAFILGKLRDDLVRVRAISKIYEGRKAAGSDEALLTRTLQSLERSREVFEENLRYYFDNVIVAVRDYPPERLDSERAALVVEFRSQDLAGLVALANLYVAHTREFRESGAVDRAKWLEEISKM